jgi:hypothetical protein
MYVRLHLVKQLSNSCFLGHNRFLNFHGQYGARLFVKQSIHSRKKETSRTYLLKILSPILFSAPNVHLTAMTEIWADKLILKPRWNEFFTKMNEEWQGHTVYVVFLLAYLFLLISNCPT